MKIGFDASGILSHIGIDRYAREVMRHVVAMDMRNEYVVLTRTSCEEPISALVAGGKHVEVRLGMPHDMMLGPMFRLVTRQLQKRVWRRKMSDVDLVHLTTHCRWLPPVKRFVVMVHDLFPLTLDDYWDDVRVEKFTRELDVLVHNASMILAPSQYVEQTIAERYPQHAARIRTTPLAAGAEFKPTAISAELLTRAGLTQDDRYLLYVGRVDDRKNIEGMMHAFLDIPVSSLRGALFVLALSGLREDIAKFKIRNAEVLRNASIRTVYGLTTADIVMLLTQARALAFATLVEGFGLPVLEAMRCGCPVLTSFGSSLPEVGGEAALYVNPYNHDAIRDGMMRLLEDDALIADLKVRGLERAQRFSWENTARLTLQAYDEAMA